MHHIRHVYVVDDDTIIRQSLSIVLRRAGYDPYPFASGIDFLDSCDDLKSGCVLLDVHMPQVDGLTVQDRIRGARPDLPIVFMTAHGDIPMAVRAMRRGAVDFLEKPFADARLLAMLDDVCATLPEQTEQRQVEADAQARIAALSRREHEVLAGLVAGLPNKIIAHRLAVGVRTVETYRANLIRKLGVRGLGEVVRIALTVGIKPLEPQLSRPN